MNEQQQSLEAIHDIKRMMERSSRFISLSGFSGISAGICALIGAWMAHPYVYGKKELVISGPVYKSRKIAGNKIILSFDFAEGLNETVEYIKNHQEVVEKRYEYSENHEGVPSRVQNDDFSF